MSTFFKSQEETINAAEKAAKENYNTYTEKGIFRCDCGESFCVRLIDEKTGNTLEEFVNCESCYYHN